VLWVRSEADAFLGSCQRGRELARGGERLGDHIFGTCPILEGVGGVVYLAMRSSGYCRSASMSAWETPKDHLMSSTNCSTNTLTFDEGGRSAT
jgi:hypothetical protein